jgi:ATP-dependent DNA ligase
VGDQRGDLEAAEQHVEAGERRVARQKEIIREFATYPTARKLAEEVLVQYEASLGILRAHRDRIRAEVLRESVGQMDLRSIELMLATNHSQFSRPGWIFEFKWDGCRVLASRDQLVTPGGNDASDSYPEIVLAFQKLHGTFVLDGKVCSLGVTGIPDIKGNRGDAPRKQGELAVFFAFDLLFLNGRDLRRMPLLERKRRLRKLIPDDRSRLRFVDFVETEGVFLFKQAINSGLAGVVGKRADSSYVGGRSRDWLRFKPGCRDGSERQLREAS